jgi:hypothetical protein
MVTVTLLSSLLCFPETYVSKKMLSNKWPMVWEAFSGFNCIKALKTPDFTLRFDK